MKISQLPEFATVAQTCEALNVDESTVRRMLENGKLGRLSIISDDSHQRHGVRVTRQSILLYLAAQGYGENTEALCLAACKALNYESLRRLIIKLSLYNNNRS